MGGYFFFKMGVFDVVFVFMQWIVVGFEEKNWSIFEFGWERIWKYGSFLL